MTLPIHFPDCLPPGWNFSAMFNLNFSTTSSFGWQINLLSDSGAYVIGRGHDAESALADAISDALAGKTIRNPLLPPEPPSPADRAAVASILARFHRPTQPKINRRI